MRDIKYKKLGFTIIRTTDNKIKSKKYVVFKNGKFKMYHTHVSTLDIGKAMIDIVGNKKMPKSKNKDFIESLIRLSDDKSYTEMLKNRLKHN